MRLPAGPAQQRGIAALTALLVVAVAVMLAAEMIWDLNLEFRRTQVLLTRDQALQVAMGVETLGTKLLEEDFKDDPGGPDSLAEDWAQTYGFPIEEVAGTVAAQLGDLQGRFNLNNLVDSSGRKNTAAIDQFRRLVQLAAAAAPEPLDVDADAVTEAVVDWIDPDQQPELGGAEDGYYTGLVPPYRAANFWFTTPTELLAVANVSPALYRQLSGLVAALPPSAAGGRPLNINTAPPLVLQSLAPEVSALDAEAWVEQAPYEERDDFWSDDGAGANKLLPPEVQDELGISSNFFRLSVIVSIGTTRFTMYSLLERTQQGAVVVRYRSFDTE